MTLRDENIFQLI
jgi:hypothetical protein